MIISQPALACLQVATDDVAGRAGALGGAARLLLRRRRPAEPYLGAPRPLDRPRPSFVISAAEPSFLAETRPERETVSAARPA